MSQRVSFQFREPRRDQRRPVSVEGWIDGVRVDLVDLSFAGGGGTIALGDDKDADFQEGEIKSLEFTGPDGVLICVPVTIQRIDHGAGEFGASFTELSEHDFEAIEKLMFPRRSPAKT